MKTHEFIKEARYCLSSILDQRGAILYSSFSTLAPGKFYILGLNPGGDADTGYTISKCLDELPQHKSNAYLDGDWSSEKRCYSCGGHPLQRHLHLLMQELGEDLNRMCAANLIFTRSPNQNSSDYPQRAQLCWPVHKMILKIVKPRIIIAFGNGNKSPYAFLALKHRETLGSEPTEVTFPAEWGQWSCKAFRTIIDTHNMLVLGIPHLSRYTIENRPTVVNWIKKKIKEHDNSVKLAQ